MLGASSKAAPMTGRRTAPRVAAQRSDLVQGARGDVEGSTPRLPLTVPEGSGYVPGNFRKALGGWVGDRGRRPEGIQFDAWVRDANFAMALGALCPEGHFYFWRRREGGETVSEPARA